MVKQIVRDRCFCSRSLFRHMIGVKKRIIVVAMGPFMFPMVNPVITKKTGEYQTEESCLSLSGVRPCTRYKEIEVDYLDLDFKPQHGKYSDFTALMIPG